MTALEIVIVPCLSDNYAYLLRSGEAVGVVDPSEAAPVLAALAQRGWTLTHILNTHHHFDHTGGNLELKAKTGALIAGPRADAERIPGIDDAYGAGDVLRLGPAAARVFDVPGHTRGHIAFWFEAGRAVFTGDTLFAMGCGRLFEGTPEQMWASLSTLAALPPETRVYCGHEYTEANGRFALSVDPENADLTARMEAVRDTRRRGEPTMPSTIALERATNPFLRAPQLLPRADPAAAFAEIRRRKDHF